jgi:acyl-CoA reductase-like NAD-dependent aldehyde dehydrogenase
MSTPTLNVIAAAMLWVLSGTALAQTPTPKQDHSSHQSIDNPAVSAGLAPEAEKTPSSEDIDKQIRAMQEMHQKMQAAQTPAERARLMQRHRNLMQESMSMMSQMRGDAHGMAGMSGMCGMMDIHRSMERRMAMMEQIMQMVIDQETVKTGN